jgi:hypothetical protein
MAQLNSTNVIGNLSVAGQLTAAGNTTFNGLVTIANITDAGVSSTNSALRIGAIGGEHLAIDGNEIIAKNNSSPSTLYLNNEGGLVQIGSGGLTVTGGGTTLQGSLGVTGATTLNSTLTVSSTATFNGALNVSGNATLGNATSDNHKVNGNITMNGTVYLANGTTYKLDSAGDANLKTLRLDSAVKF